MLSGIQRRLPLAQPERKLRLQQHSYDRQHQISQSWYSGGGHFHPKAQYYDLLYHTVISTSRLAGWYCYCTLQMRILHSASKGQTGGWSLTWIPPLFLCAESWKGSFQPPSLSGVASHSLIKCLLGVGRAWSVYAVRA
jgi:hypothetical protein